jgi:hypothetical protein
LICKAQHLWLVPWFHKEIIRSKPEIDNEEDQAFHDAIKLNNE